MAEASGECGVGHGGARGIQSLSVTIVTRNEASRIRACLDSVYWADEIVVVDSGSTDSTQAICRERGATVLERAWEGYASQKNFAIENSRHPWVLSVDADERVSDGLREQILGVLGADGPADGYRFPRRNIFFGKWLRHGDLWPDYQIRLFRRGHGHFKDRAVHESVAIRGVVGVLSEPLEHYSYANLQEFFSRQVRYAALSARERAGQGGKPHLRDFLVRPLWRFFKSYFLKSGWRDGFEGFLVSVGFACYVFMRAAFMWEIHRRRENA